uniref:CSON014819 protein n=1 Tax=Culicoides sonorensis TaxID=179676 RepID=A0A336MBV3_CULSO
MFKLSKLLKNCVKVPTRPLLKSEGGCCVVLLQRNYSKDNKFNIKDDAFEGRPLYLDAQATTPMDPRVLDAMLPYLTNYYGNPHSRTHAYGWESEAAMEKARESLLMALKDIALSSGSACTSASLEPSYVLRAIGTDEDLAHSSIRFGIGRFTTIEEVDYTAEKCIKHVQRLREMSPLWEMVQEGIDIKSIQWSQH